MPAINAKKFLTLFFCLSLLFSSLFINFSSKNNQVFAAGSGGGMNVHGITGCVYANNYGLYGYLTSDFKQDEASTKVTAGSSSTYFEWRNAQKRLWYSNDYPRLLVRINGTKFQITALSSLESIDEGRGCVGTSTQISGYTVKYMVHAADDSSIISHRISVTNNTGTTLSNWQASFGGDTWFAGSDSGYPVVIANSPAVKKDANSGIMAIFTQPHAQYYSSQHYSQNNTWMDAFNQTNQVSDYNTSVDMGIGVMWWNPGNIPPGETFTLQANSSIASAAALQIIGDSEQTVYDAGGEATHTFTFINVGKSSIRDTIEFSASNGWTVSPTSTVISVPNGGSTQVTVKHKPPETANITLNNYRSTVTARSLGYNATGSVNSQVMVPLVNSLQTTSRTGRFIYVTPSWGVRDQETPNFTLQVPGFGEFQGVSDDNGNSFSFDLGNSGAQVTDGTYDVIIKYANKGFPLKLPLRIPDYNAVTINGIQNQYTLKEGENVATANNGSAYPNIVVRPTGNSNPVTIQVDPSTPLPEGLKLEYADSAKTQLKFSGVGPVGGWYYIRVLGYYTKDGAENAVTGMLRIYSQPKDGGTITKPREPKIDITKTWLTGQDINYKLPEGFEKTSGNYPLGLKVENGILKGKLPDNNVGQYIVEGNIGTEYSQKIIFNILDGIAPVIVPGTLELQGTSDNKIQVKIPLSAKDNIDPSVSLDVSGLPNGWIWNGKEVIGTQDAGSPAREIKVYVYAKDSSGNTTNGAYSLPLPYVVLEDGEVTTGGRNPVIAYSSPSYAEVGQYNKIYVTVLPSRAKSVVNMNIAGLPPSLTWDAEKKAIVGTPTDEQAGEYTLKITGTDSVTGLPLKDEPHTMKLIINDNAAPVIESGDSIFVDAGSSGSFDISLNEKGTVTIDGLPEGFTITQDGDKGVKVSYDATVKPGVYKATVNAKDSHGNYSSKVIDVYVIKIPSPLMLPDSGSNNATLLMGYSIGTLMLLLGTIIAATIGQRRKINRG